MLWAELCSAKTYAAVLTPGCANMTLFGNKVRECHTELGQALNPMTAILRRLRETQTDRVKKEGHVMAEMLPEARDLQEPLDAGRGKEGLFPTGFRRSMVLTAP